MATQATTPSKAAVSAAGRTGEASIVVQRAVSRRELLWTFMMVAALGAIFAFWLSFMIEDAIGDAMSRTYAALLVTHAHDPHLAAIGFIWPPLPTMVQIPLLLVTHFAFYGFSGGLMCALFAGLTAVVLNLILARAGIEGSLRWCALALFFLNPFILFYSANGMSEMPFVFAFVFAVYCFLRWTDNQQMTWLILGGIASAIMVLVRYDAVPFSAAFAAAVALTLVRTRLRRGRSQIGANAIVYLTPVAFMTLLWVYFNWQIQHDPLYFLHSEYSNAFLVRDTALSAEVQRLRSSLVVFAVYLVKITLALSPLLVAALVALFALAVRRRNAAYLGLIGLLLVVPAFQALSYRSGQTFGFWRFYITLIPAGLIAATELIRGAGSAKIQRWAYTALVFGLAIGNITTALAMSTVVKPQSVCNQSATPEQEFMRSLGHPLRQVDSCRDEREMATYITAHIGQRAVLTDVSGNLVVVFTRRPDLFVLLSDRDFVHIADNPTPTDYVLTARRTSPEFRALDSYFPDLDTGAPPGLTLAHESGLLRLYRVTGR